MFVGIKMDMQKNWHTYWKNPGDSGGPIEVSWTLPDGMTISDIYWPINITNCHTIWQSP
jgi:thiol:disulfide interchange protein DsbD